MRYFAPLLHSWHFPCPRTESFLLEWSSPLFVVILWDIVLRVFFSEICQQLCLSSNSILLFCSFFPFSRGFAVGIYTTNSPDACHYVAENCSANIIVVENHKQLQKILEVIMFLKWLGVAATCWQMWEGKCCGRAVLGLRAEVNSLVCSLLQPGELSLALCLTKVKCCFHFLKTLGLKLKKPKWTTEHPLGCLAPSQLKWWLFLVRQTHSFRSTDGILLALHKVANLRS